MTSTNIPDSALAALERAAGHLAASHDELGKAAEAAATVQAELASQPALRAEVDRLGRGIGRIRVAFHRSRTRSVEIWNSVAIEKAAQAAIERGRHYGWERDSIRFEIVAFVLACHTRKQLITWLRVTGRPVPLIRLRLNLHRHITNVLLDEHLPDEASATTSAGTVRGGEPGAVEPRGARASSPSPV